MESFPSLLERTVASALLLLSAQPPSLSPPNSDESKVNVESEKSSCYALSNSNETESKISVESLALSTSRSCSSTVTTDDGSSAETRAHPLRMIAAVARCHEMKLKVVRKKRSKKFWISDIRKPISIRKPTEAAKESETTSCVSSSSSAVSSGRSRGGGGRKEPAAANLLGRNSKTKEMPAVVKSALLRRRAEAIKRLLLSNGSTPTGELRIRQLLGDSPDTSKALRMLLKQELIKRSGVGGRSDPYLYTIA